MSQASGGEDLWTCINSACTGHPPIPHLIGSAFTSCPFCKTEQPTGKHIRDQKITAQVLSQRAILQPEAEADLVTRASNLEICTPQCFSELQEATVSAIKPLVTPLCKGKGAVGNDSHSDNGVGAGGMGTTEETGGNPTLDPGEVHGPSSTTDPEVNFIPYG